MHSNPERLAWQILLASFIVFVLICAALVYAIQWFLFSSMITMPLELIATRGTVTLIPAETQTGLAVADRRGDIEPDDIIQTGETSQAMLSFWGTQTETPIAALVIFRDSEINVTHASAPRFNLNHNPNRIQVSSNSGHFDIVVPHNPETEIIFEVKSPQATIQIKESGHVTIHISEEGTTVTTYKGDTQVVNESRGNFFVLSEEESVFISSAIQEPDINQAAEPLIENYNFEDPFESGWDFYNDREPAGTAQNVIIDGRTAVMIDRSQENWVDITLGHGETGLVQFLESDVSGYSFLEIRGTFYVAEQSLSTCGIAGSECPVMIKMKYINPEGLEQEFIHGFYAYHDPATAWPIICQTCRSEHERININSWYTYESGNLITNAPSQRPIKITEFSFYASGHAYKVYFSEMVIRAEK